MSLNTNSIKNSLNGTSASSISTTTDVAGIPILAYFGAGLSQTFSNTAYAQVVPSNSFTLPNGTTAVRITYAINVYGAGLGNNEHLQCYAGLTDGINSPKGQVYTSVYPFSKGTENLGGGQNPVTISMTEYIQITSNALPYTAELYCKTNSGVHTASFNLMISVEPLR